MTMQTKRKIPDKPRFNLVRNKAHKFLIDFGFTELPVSIERVIEEMSYLSYNVYMTSYSDALKTMNTPDPFNLKSSNTEALTIRVDDKYIIIYDDTLFVPETRIRWSQMHEIAHILLGHLNDFSSADITSAKYRVLEVEANYFVSEFLMPTPVIQSIGNMTTEQICRTFFVSEEAARKKISQLQNNYFESSFAEKLYRNFYDIIHRKSEVFTPDNSDYTVFENWNYIREKLKDSFEEDILEGSSAFFDDDGNLIIYSPLILFDIRVNESVILNAIRTYTSYKPENMLVYSTPDSRYHLVASAVGAVEYNGSIQELLADKNM